jgi:hypothetical protein
MSNRRAFLSFNEAISRSLVVLRKYVTRHWQPGCLIAFRELLQDTLDQATGDGVGGRGDLALRTGGRWQSFFALE